MKDETKVIVAGRHPEDNHGIVNPPVYHASTVLHQTMADWDASVEARQAGERGVYYGRSGTPTTFALEDAVTAVEGGYRCLCASSGLGAISIALLAYVKTGDHVLMVDSVYGPARRFANSVLARFGVETTFYDPLIGAGIGEMIRPNTKVVYTEAPGSQTFEMQDIPAIADVAHRHGATVVMDNTWASPLYFKPFEHGVDVSIQAATKYMVGHSDVMLGTATATKEAWPALEEAKRDLGQASGPDDVYLTQRGFRTLAVRLKQHWAQGVQLAEWFRARPEVDCVMHPALPSDPGHDLWKRDFLGASGLFGVTLKPASRAAVAAFVDSLELFGMGASWGGYESLVLVTSPNNFRDVRRWPYEGPTLRFHAGLEALEDLTDDLETAFKRFNAAA